MTLLKHIKRVAFCASIAFLAFNCQKEDDTLQVQQTALKSNINISRLNTKAIENDKNLMRIINKAEAKRIESKANKTVYNAQYDFTINTNYAKVITHSNGLKNYTFGVYRTEDNGVLENLLLQEQEDHSFKVSLVQYNITPNERNSLASREIVDVEGKITYITLEDISDTIFDKVNSDAETCTVYSYEWEAGNLCDSGQHDYADGVACDYWSNPDKAATSGGWVLTSNETSCGDGGGSTGNTDTNSNSTNPNQTTSNGGGITVEPSTTPVLCPGCPVINEEDCLLNITKDPTFSGTEMECIFDRIKGECLTGESNTFRNMLLGLSDLNTPVRFSSKPLTGAEANHYAITNGEITDFAGNTNTFYEVVSNSTVMETKSNLEREVTLIHEVAHVYMFNSLVNFGIIEFDTQGAPVVANLTALCNNFNIIPNVNLNSYTLKDRWVYLICEFNHNNPTYPNNEQWTHSFFNTANFDAQVYREAIEQYLLQNHDWDNEPTIFKDQAINAFGVNNWKQILAERVSWMGLEKLPEFILYQNSFSSNVVQNVYMLTFDIKLQSANKNCL